ncbi:MAG: hypothetical protein ABIH39_01550 [Candidatus Margulisiibacteriota bacterium]
MNNKYKNTLEYEGKPYKVRSAIKTFRDLQVYAQTTSLSADIFWVEIPAGYKRNDRLKAELVILNDLSKMVPRLIAESYGDKFNNLDLALQKLEKTSQVVSNVVAKLDFFISAVDDPDFREKLLGILKKYQYLRPKILNLKYSWINVFKKGENSDR